MINIVITGQIKNEKIFRKFIVVLIELRKKRKINEVIYSTWHDEVNKFEGLRCLFLDNKFQIIESTPPTNCKGTILHQMKSFHLGLNSIENKNLILD